MDGDKYKTNKTNMRLFSLQLNKAIFCVIARHSWFLHLINEGLSIYFFLFFFVLKSYFIHVPKIKKANIVYL